MIPAIIDLLDRLEAPVVKETRPAHYVTVEGRSIYVPQEIRTAQSPLHMEAARVIRELMAR